MERGACGCCGIWLSKNLRVLWFPGGAGGGGAVGSGRYWGGGLLRLRGWVSEGAGDSGGCWGCLKVLGAQVDAGRGLRDSVGVPEGAGGSGHCWEGVCG